MINTLEKIYNSTKDKIDKMKKMDSPDWELITVSNCYLKDLEIAIRNIKKNKLN